MTVVNICEESLRHAGSALEATPVEVLQQALADAANSGEGKAVILLPSSGATLGFRLYVAGLTIPELIGWLEGAKFETLREWAE